MYFTYVNPKWQTFNERTYQAADSWIEEVYLSQRHVTFWLWLESAPCQHHYSTQTIHLGRQVAQSWGLRTRETGSLHSSQWPHPCFYSFNSWRLILRRYKLSAWEELDHPEWSVCLNSDLIQKKKKKEKRRAPYSRKKPHGAVWK